MNIPELSEELLQDLARRIRPVVRDQSQRLRFIEAVDLRTVSFTWNPNFTDAADHLVDVVRIRTLHTYAYYGFFKPTIAEVLAQIPAEMVPEVSAFETIGPFDATDLNREIGALNAGFHVAMTTLYREERK